MRWSPPRPVAFGTASPIPWAYGDNPRVSLGPGEEIIRVLRAHFVVAVVVTDVSPVWVVIHMRPERPWYEHHLLRVREIWIYIPLVPWLYCCLGPPRYWPVHVVQIDAEPIDSLWDGKIGDRLFLSIVPFITRTVEERGFVGPDDCGTSWEGSTYSARILDVVLSRQSSPKQRGSA